jgi:hypothetical protein
MLEKIKKWPTYIKWSIGYVIATLILACVLFPKIIVFVIFALLLIGFLAAVIAIANYFTE